MKLDHAARCNSNDGAFRGPLVYTACMQSLHCTVAAVLWDLLVVLLVLLRDVTGIASDPKMRKGIFLTNCCGTF